MRLLLLSPYFPPDKGGVSDHTAHFLQEAALRGCSADVLTFCATPEPVPGATIHVIKKSWRTLNEWEERLRSSPPDRILVQFTPLAFADTFYGIAPWLALVLMRLKRATGAPVFLFAHETHYPARLSPTGILVGLPQFLQFVLLAAVCEKIFFSHIASMRFWIRWFPWKKSQFEVIPVFSNIDRKARACDVRKKFSIPPDAKFLFYFGGAHDMNLLDYVVDSHRRLREKYPSQGIWLVMAGVSAEEVRKKLSVLPADSLVVTGYIPAAEVSELYLESLFVLAPFGEGINTRRGSAMAALAHGKAVVTTRGWCTGQDYSWDSFLALANDKGAYIAAVEALFANPEEILRLGKAAQESYERNFSRGAVTERILRAMRV